MKPATTIEQQIKILEERGMTISDKEKASEILLDIGYFRLGFYFVPFQDTSKQEKQYVKGANFKDAVDLYYFDNELRNILLKYIYRIEINFRNQVSYYVSIKNSHSPTWFVDNKIVNSSYVEHFDKDVYNEHFKKHKTIRQHHDNYINDKYAPAWKTLEFMTFGAIIKLFKELRDTNIKKEISGKFNISNLVVFLNYIEIVCIIRNICSHCDVLYDMSLSKSIKRGPAGEMKHKDKHSIKGVLQVILYMLEQISKNRSNDLKSEIKILSEKYKDNQNLTKIIQSKLHF